MTAFYLALFGVIIFGVFVFTLVWLDSPTKAQRERDDCDCGEW